MANSELYKHYPVVYEKTLGKLFHIEVRNSTPNPTDFTLKARHFIDPFDVRLYTTFTFLNCETNTDKWDPKSGKVNNSMINEIIQGITKPSKPIKRLIARQTEYITTIAKQQANSSTTEVYGSDVDVFDRIAQLPINQELQIGSLFTLIEANDTFEGLPYAKMILSESITPKDTLKIFPFHRRTPVITLLPGEAINAVFAVEKAPPNLSANQLDMFSRPDLHILRLGTRLSENPFRMMSEQMINATIKMINRLFKQEEEPSSSLPDEFKSVYTVIDPESYVKVLEDEAGQIDKVIKKIYTDNAA